MPETAPALSFVVVVDDFRYIRELVEALRRQPNRDRIELVVGAPSERELRLDEDAVEGLAVRVVETGPITSAPEAREIAARAARAPYVFVGETHCFPEPDWGTAILAAHEQGWDTVVPVLTNGNPNGALSWASFLLAYGRVWAPAPSVELDAAPPHNASLPREVVGRHLEGGKGFGDIRLGNGRRVLRTPDARMAHVNIAMPREWLDERFVIGRIYGADRSRRWSSARRAGYVVAAPVLPVVQFAHTLHAVGLARVRSLPPLTLPAMLLGSIVSVAGEVAAYAAGPPSAATRRRMDEYELHRRDYAGHG